MPLVALLGAFAILAPIAMSDPSPAGAAQRTSGIPAPLMWSRSFADPTVVESRVGVRRGGHRPNLNIGRAQADAGPWNVIATPALTRRPGWATSADLWAPDIQRAPGGWLMYFAAPIAGADENSRCIGVAVLQEVVRPVHPDRQRARSCARSSRASRAPADTPPTKVLGKRSPTRGVIDPSSFIGNKGQRFLVYRTQGQPSSIRLVKLSAARPPDPAGQVSMLLTSNPGIEENPVITRHDDKWVMFTSVGWFGHCGYRTYWRRSPDFRDWSRADAEAAALDGQRPVRPGRRRRAAARDGRTQLYFHAWTCYREPLPVPGRLEQGPAAEAQGRAGVVRRQPAVVGRRPAADRELDRRRPAAAPAADPHAHARRRPRRPTADPDTQQSHVRADLGPDVGPDSSHLGAHVGPHLVPTSAADVGIVLNRVALANRRRGRRAWWCVVFATIGRASHDEGLRLAGVWHTAWPFLVGTALALAWAASREGRPAHHQGRHPGLAADARRRHGAAPAARRRHGAVLRGGRDPGAGRAVPRLAAGRAACGGSSAP